MATNASTCQKRSLSTEEVIECIYADNDSKSGIFSSDYLTLFRMGLLGSAHGWEGGRGKKTSLPKIFHTYPTTMKLGTVISYLQNI